MALYIPGVPCALCKQPVLAQHEPALFPWFTKNEADELYIFNDAVVHADCLRRDPRADQLERRIEFLHQSSGPGNRACEVCRQQILDPDEFFALGYLTGDIENALYRWNHAKFHRSCLGSWTDLNVFLQLADSELRAGRWKGPGMDWLVARLREVAAVS